MFFGDFCIISLDDFWNEEVLYSKILITLKTPFNGIIAYWSAKVRPFPNDGSNLGHVYGARMTPRLEEYHPENYQLAGRKLMVGRRLPVWDGKLSVHLPRSFLQMVPDPKTFVESQ